MGCYWKVSISFDVLTSIYIRLSIRNFCFFDEIKFMECIYMICPIIIIDKKRHLFYMFLQRKCINKYLHNFYTNNSGTQW